MGGLVSQWMDFAPQVRQKIETGKHSARIISAEVHNKSLFLFVMNDNNDSKAIIMTKTDSIIIRLATPKDAKAIQEIYAPYVRETAITFEYDVPTAEEMVQRIMKVEEKYPWLVAEEDGKVIGYAYASPFKERDAYQWSVETSIYVETGAKGRGIGRLLHEALEETLKVQGILNLNACIAFIEHDDPNLPLDSVYFHERMGYTQVAHFHLCGKKFGRWYDMIWMEKLIGEHQ